MLKKVRKVLNKMKPMAFVMLSLVTSYMTLSKTVMEKGIE